jgi:hypothetical protein|tara:strand:+ start:520 stop:918 length:399 start_codon:yes stop_codon:yes gene_type:complete
MSNEKKIEDLIYSISSLIKEAQQENKLLLEIDNNIENLDLRKENIIPNKKISFSDKIKDENLKENNTSKFYDWKSIKFLKENLEKDFKDDLEKSFLKIFESEINLWMKANLKNIIQTELNKFSSKIIAEKLK